MKKNKASKASVKKAALREWWNREPWPALILAVDPGRLAGVSLVRSRPKKGLSLIFAENIDVYDRKMEILVKEAIDKSLEFDEYLFLVLETWGAGGRMGIDQWVGLGEMRGPWRREFLLNVRDNKSIYLRQKNVFTVTQSRWRSRVIQESGMRNEFSKFIRFTPGEWKEKAHEKAKDFFIDRFIPPLDASEATCMGIYAARSDEIGSRLPRSLLRKYDLEYKSLEKKIKMGV